MFLGKTLYFHSTSLYMMTCKWVWTGSTANSLLTDTPVSRQRYLQTLFSIPLFPFFSYGNNSCKRTALLMDNFFNSLGCLLTRELTVPNFQTICSLCVFPVTKFFLPAAAGNFNIYCFIGIDSLTFL